jgi:integrase/recombinase XerD
MPTLNRKLLGAFKVYLLTQKRSSKNTVAAYSSDLGQLYSFLEAEEITWHPTADNLKAFIKNLRTERMISGRSLARKVCSIKMFFTYLAQHHDLEDTTQNLVLPKTDQRLPGLMSEANVAKLLNASTTDKTPAGIRNATMLHLLYGTGLRVSELVNLKLEALRLDERLITIVGKRDKGRMVPIHQEIATMLKAYITGARKKLLKTFKATSDVLFPVHYANQVKPMSRQAFWGLLKKLARGALPEGQSVHPHMLRHSLATHLLRKGADLRSLQLLLGHETLATVQVYTHLDTEDLRNLYDKKHPRS